MAQADSQLKGELWQVLSHAFANSLIAVGLVIFLGGAIAFAFLPNRQLSIVITLTGALLAAVALVMHLIAWV